MICVPELMVALHAAFLRGLGVDDTDSAVRLELLLGELKGVSGMTGGAEWPLLSVESTWRPLLQAGVA